MVTCNSNSPTPRSITELLGQDALTVAPMLLGMELSVVTPEGEVGGIIVETEAYRANDDPASHAYRSLTVRNAPMYMVGGTIYCYLSYGLHTMFNIVTGPSDTAQAVLIRALEPTIGINLMARRRSSVVPQSLCSGPAKLTQALGILVSDSGTLVGEKIRLRYRNQYYPEKIITSSRIGITQGKDLPWRFLFDKNSYVSRQ